MRQLASMSLGRGAQQLAWDGRLPQGTRAYAGAYVAHLVVRSSVGTSEFRIPFAFRR
jgi:hypothetical protein